MTESTFIRDLRIARGITQKELANELNVTQSIISFWETGSKFPSTKNLVGLAKALNCTADDLLMQSQHEAGNG